MLRRLMVIGLAMTLATGLLLIAGSTAGLVGGPARALAAAGSGVGPSSSGATGQPRACEAHAANTGQSDAGGLSCPSFSATLLGMDTAVPGGCDVQFTGSGLAPNATVYFALPGGPEPVMAAVFPMVSFLTVGSDGVLNGVGYVLPSFSPYTFQVQDASGNTQSVTLLVPGGC